MTTALYGSGLYGRDEYAGGSLSLVSIRVDGVELDLADVLADVTIRHGRAGYFDAASASTAQLTLIGVDRATTRPFRLGSLLELSAVFGATAAPRFTGRFTDADLDGDRLTAIAVGRLRTLSGRTVGASDWPAESWSARLTRAFTEAGLASVLALELGAFNPNLIARPAAATDLARYLDELAGMVGAAVADLPDGRILVQTVESRSVDAVIVDVDPADVFYAPGWAMRLPGGNVVTVKYGDPEATVSVTDAASVALYEPIAVTIETDFANVADANALAANRVARDSFAHWTMPAAPLLVGLDLPIGSLVSLSSLPAAAPFDPWPAVVEGWTDTIAADRGELVWTMELALSDPLLSGLAVAWQDVPAGQKWNTINATVAWRDVLTLADLNP